MAASVAGLTVVQPLTAAPPLLLASLLMNDGSGDSDGVSGIADAIQGRLLPSDGRTVIVNFLTGPFGLWNPLDQSDTGDSTVPSTTIGVASALPFLSQQGLAALPPTGPLAPGQLPNFPQPEVPGQVVAFDAPSLQIGEAIVTSPPMGPFPMSSDVVTSYGYDLSSYATVSALNPFALTNSVAAYLNGALSPVEVNAKGEVVCRHALSCNVDDLNIVRVPIDGGYIITFTHPDGTKITATVVTRDGVTYVTYENNGPLPLVRPLRDYGGLLGNELADFLEPALTALVYWGYRDATGANGNGLLPTPAETIQSLLNFIVGVKQGIESLFRAHEPSRVSGPAPTRIDAGTATDPDEPAPVKSDNKTPAPSSPPVQEPVAADDPAPTVTEPKHEPEPASTEKEPADGSSQQSTPGGTPQGSDDASDPDATPPSKGGKSESRDRETKSEARASRNAEEANGSKDTDSKDSDSKNSKDSKDSKNTDSKANSTDKKASGSSSDAG
ncbi:MAG: hypothetical protein WBB07_25605 [Mycobacterium sp.]